MEKENVNQLHWALQQLFGRGEIRSELLADDVEWVNPHDAVEPGTRRGPEGFNGAIASVFATWDDVRFDTERVIENGDDVVAIGVLHGHVRAAGMEIDSPHGQIWTFRDGRVVRMRWFNTHSETLEAAGLSVTESGMGPEENVELVRVAVAAYQRRDAQALRAITHEDAEVFTLTEGETEGEPFRGHAGIGEWLEDELDPWEEFRVEPLEISAVGERVLMRSRVTARGKGSSVELNASLSR